MKKTLFSVEIPVRSSPNILFEFLSTPTGLQEWFAEQVSQQGKIFHFTWNGVTDEAELLESVENEFVRFRWDYSEPDEYFEFRISQSAVTNETILIVSDFADQFDLKDQQQLWETQVNDLKSRIGS